jgi:hypothetical protein
MGNMASNRNSPTPPLHSATNNSSLLLPKVCNNLGLLQGGLPIFNVFKSLRNPPYNSMALRNKDKILVVGIRISRSSFRAGIREA